MSEPRSAADSATPQASDYADILGQTASVSNRFGHQRGIVSKAALLTLAYTAVLAVLR